MLGQRHKINYLFVQEERFDTSAGQFFPIRLKERFVDFVERMIMGEGEALLFGGIISFIWIMFALDLYLNLRQRKVMKENINPPYEILNVMTRENYNKSRLYSLDKNTYNIMNSSYSMLQISFVLISDILPWLWSFSVRSTIPWTKERNDIPLEEDLSEEHEIRASLTFLLYVTLFTFVDSLPWKYYNTFTIEERHGFNKQTTVTFLLDQTKSLVVSLGLILPISYCLLYIIKWGGSHFHLYAWSFAFVVMMFLMFFYPEFIAPLFDKHIILPESQLKQSIEELADNLQFPLKRIYVVQGSNRNSHSNAYFFGLTGNKRIVLFDNLIGSMNLQFNRNGETTGDENEQRHKGCLDSEVLAIVAHELGHWKLNHVIQNLIIGQINLFLMFYAFGNLFGFNLLFKSFGFREVGTPSLLKLVLIFQFLFSPYNALLEFLMTLFSRQNEFQADDFVVKMGKGEHLKNALIKIQNDRLNFPLYDKYYSMFNHSYPPLLERLNAIDNENIIKSE